MRSGAFSLSTLPPPVFPAKTRPARLLSPAMVAPRLSPCFFGFQSQPIFNPSDRPTLCRICIIHLYSFSNITDGQGLCLSCMFVLSVMYGYTTLQGAYRVAKAPHRVPMGCLELVITGLITASYSLMIPRNSAHMTAATSLLACSSSRMASYALDPAKSLSLSAVSSRTARAFSAES